MPVCDFTTKVLFRSKIRRGFTMLAILKDAEGRPDLFGWFGAIPRAKIESWAGLSSIRVPGDLLEFWSQTGGGDLFESETIFRPTLIPSPEPYFMEGDDVDCLNRWCIGNGMSPSYLAFHDGLYLSAIQLANQSFVTLDKKFQESAVFATFDEWYVRTLRADFGARYGLPDDVNKR
jgi:hypothetical protein